jgi:hypothetical protein
MSAKGQATSPNFGFLAKRYPQLERVGAQSERYFADDPTVSPSFLERERAEVFDLIALSGPHQTKWCPQTSLSHWHNYDHSFPQGHTSSGARSCAPCRRHEQEEAFDFIALSGHYQTSWSHKNSAKSLK